MTKSPGQSFRDPSGRLYVLKDCALRIVYPEAGPIVATLLHSPLINQQVQNGSIVAAEPCDAEAAALLLKDSGITPPAPSETCTYLRHELIPFISYPSEWPPEMLHAAASLTLETMELLLPEGIGIKDATPYNVLFRGTTPVFVDFLSFEKRDDHDPTWLGYAQFVRMFLVPLLASKEFDYPLDALFIGSRDGMEPESLYGIASALQRITPPFLTLVSIPTWLGRNSKSTDSALYSRPMMDDAVKARFILTSLLGRLKQVLKRLQPADNRTSVWKNYTETHSYSDAQFDEKCGFVSKALQQFSPATVLDVGCNNGLFSRLAARSGAKVVAIDYDKVVVGDLWRNARNEQLDILPLVVNLARPTPAVGWRNAECSSFLDRARGKFAGVLMLAVIHHLLVTEGIPLDEIIEVASQLTTDMLVIEFVAPGDSMFRKLARGRDNLYTWLTQEVFEQECRKRFEIVECLPLGDINRTMYVMKKLPH